MAGQRKTPARKAPATKKDIRLYPPPPQDFDPFAATKRDLMKYGLPLRPDPHKEPGMAALWERQAARYRSFEHLEPRPDTTTANKKGLPAKIPAGTAPFLRSGPDRVVRLPALQPLGPVHGPVRHLDGARPAVQPRPVRPDRPLPHLRRSRLPRRPRRDDRRLRAERHQQDLGAGRRGRQPAGPPRRCDQRQPVPPNQRQGGLLPRQRDHRSSRSALRSTPAFRLLSRSTRASLAPATPASLLSSTRWRASASSTSTRSAPTRRVAAGRSRRATPSRWSTRTARPSPGPSGSTTSPSRRCSSRRSSCMS